MKSTTQPAQLRVEPYVWRIVGVVIVGMIMSILDTTIVNVALDTLSKDLDSTISQIQWVATGYLLPLAAVIPLTGWAARRFGAKRVYIGSIVVFTLGSALCALADSTASLVAFRVLRGIGGGCLSGSPTPSASASSTPSGSPLATPTTASAGCAGGTPASPPGSWVTRASSC
ncbi:MAG: MFS transporter [Syntrophothermus sp.]